MQLKFVAPTTSETAFNCPHCGALAKQFWYHLKGEALEHARTPTEMDEEDAETFVKNFPEGDGKEVFIRWAKRLAQKTPFLEDERSDPYTFTVWNTALSKCFNCNDISIWIFGRLMYPSASNVVPPNPDMPEEAKYDYREAAAISEFSPRGSAALLRLAVQKICVSLGGDGKNINDDIAGLVRDGLDKRVQQALDIVRVTGNNAVHPGEMDIRDNREIAEKLFVLVNLICDVMISQPKQIASLYETLPEGARTAVERRDGSKSPA